MTDPYTGRPLNEHQLAAKARQVELERWHEENDAAHKRAEIERAREKKRQLSIAKIELLAQRKELETSLERRLRAAGPISDAEVAHLLPKMIEQEILRRASAPEDVPDKYAPLVR